MTAQPRANSKSERFRILVVDDHEFVRRGVCALFSRDPRFDVCGEAVNGQEAVEQVKLLRPDIVVLDISMPVMNGLEAAQEIRRTAPDTKIVILTMHDSNVMREQARKAGADAFAVKSDIASRLIETVESLLPISTP